MAIKYTTEAGAHRARVSLNVGNIHKSGSVRGMQERFGWPRGGQVRVGSYVYNVGVEAVEKLRRSGELKG